MKFQYVSDWSKKVDRQNSLEDSLILNSKYSPNEKVIFKNKVFTLNYPSVRNDELTWLAECKQGWFWLPERLLV